MHILFVEDEARLASAIRRVLKEENHVVDWVADGEDGLVQATTEQYDLLLLDVMLPSMDGYAITREVRASGQDTPILMLTARDAIADRVKGLDAGADDYLVKPFALEELLARVRALTRRNRPPGADGDGNVLRIGDLSLNLRTREADRQGRRSS